VELPAGADEEVTAEQRRWWEEGCYCPAGACICGTAADPFRIEPEETEEEKDGQ
jgi:hypothetical protein